MTNVPDENLLSKEKTYYVYEWYIKATGQVFYIGKGKGNRYKNPTRNALFNRIRENLDCDVRFVAEGLTEHEALVKEEELFKVREDEGQVLANIVTPNAEGGLGTPPKLEYWKTPLIYPSRVEAAYFGGKLREFDPIDEEKLKWTFVPKWSRYDTGRLYVDTDEDLIPQEKTEEALASLLDELDKRIRSIGGKVYKSKAKSVQSLIVYTDLMYENYVNEKEKGYDVYHLIDVLNFLRNR